jgi:hypothetical protein
MKTRILVFLVLSMAMCACNTTRRVQRRIRRIVERCPELVVEQAHPIDTFLAVPLVADSAKLPMVSLKEGKPVAVTTEKGIFTATITDDTLTLTYETEPEPIHFTDTLHYAQVVIEEAQPNKKPPNVFWFLLGMVIVLAGILVFVMVVIIKMVKAS